MPPAPVMHVQIRLKPPKKVKPKKESPLSVVETIDPPRNQPVPSYDEALMMPERVPDPPQSALVSVYVEPNAEKEEEEDSYSADGESFESYSVEGGEEEAELELESKHGGTSANGQVELGAGSDNDDGNDQGDDDDAEEDVEDKSSEEGRADSSPLHHHSARARQVKAKTARQRDAVSYSYDENTYAVVTRLRAQNKRLVSQLEQQCKLINSLTEEKKQQQRVIQTLRADVNMHKQTIHALQTTSARGARLSIGQRSQIDLERPATTSSAFPSSSCALPHMPKANDAVSYPESPRSIATRWVASPPSLSPTATASPPRTVSPPCSPPPLSPSGHRRSRTGGRKLSEEAASSLVSSLPNSPSPQHHRRHEKKT